MNDSHVWLYDISFLFSFPGGTGMFDFYISTASSKLHFITRRTGLNNFYFALLLVRLRFLPLHFIT